MAASAAAADSAIGLAITAGGGATHLGPGLASGMSEAEVFERLNAWGIARDSDLLDLKSNLVATQTVVATTFDQARARC